MRITVSPPPITSKTLAADLHLQTWLQKAGQHLTDSSDVKTITGAAGEVLIASRSGSRIHWEYAGGPGDSWNVFGQAVTIPASTQPVKDWKHIQEQT